MHIFWFVTSITISFFGLCFFAIIFILIRSKWSLKRALSEPLMGKEPEPIVGKENFEELGITKDMPIYIESCSRLIALVGLTAVLAIDLGLAITIFYSNLVPDQNITLDLTAIGVFLVAQAGIFAPYIANQIRCAAVGAGWPKSNDSQ